MKRTNSDLFGESYGEVIVPLLLEHDLINEADAEEYIEYIKFVPVGSVSEDS